MVLPNEEANKANRFLFWTIQMWEDWVLKYLLGYHFIHPTVCTLTDVALPPGPLLVAEAPPGLLVEAAVAGAVRQAGEQALVAPLAPAAHPAQVAVAAGVLLAAGAVPGAGRVRAGPWRRKKRGRTLFMH